jgi:hypothetical protein
LIDAANRIEKDTLVESNEPMCRVGQMYENGIGVDKNIQIAIKRYSYAANNVGIYLINVFSIAKKLIMLSACSCLMSSKITNKQ